MNIFGDIAGNYFTFLALLKQMPDDEVVSLGDFIDRGPRSKEVLEWLQAHGKALLGNHEHMLIDSYLRSQNPSHAPYYSPGLWVDHNGGLATLKSYDPNFDPKTDKIHELVPDSHIKYLQSLPLFLETDDLFLSHAPLRVRANPVDAMDLGQGFHNNFKTKKADTSLLWNIAKPRVYEDKLQIFGHIGFNEPRYYSSSFRSGTRTRPNEKIYALGVDTSLGSVLTAVNYPSMKIYQQKYID